jgi:hypothetical protein
MVSMSVGQIEDFLDELYELEVSRNRVETIWSLSHYDGPATGIVRYEGKIYFAYTEEEFLQDLHRKRVFFLVDLGDEWSEAAVDWCERRMTVAGNGMRWTPNGERYPSAYGAFGSHSSKTFSILYRIWRRENPIPNREVPRDTSIAGWFRGWKCEEVY